ncbi:uncharacterized protein MONBRDRAFT_29001 [Monosiga brevicollis MX1]|uniref:Uncharacterized protein n=1 Tax=Monosiga brevicollis TaxID=81824 RepID=A9V9T7_MONBE|nr:uncharacterized protein MONBRDRAFT_29001 [Monosiga brevicollis MX1]EDQ85722.1 predicted protein [Monosiga brevicollis MX1]|eukprot:XP_001749437.1 hypothetical protein [Monosiga brevicollis MX1]
MPLVPAFSPFVCALAMASEVMVSISETPDDAASSVVGPNSSPSAHPAQAGAPGQDAGAKAAQSSAASPKSDRRRSFTRLSFRRNSLVTSPTKTIMVDRNPTASRSRSATTSVACRSVAQSLDANLSPPQSRRRRSSLRSRRSSVGDGGNGKGFPENLFTNRHQAAKSKTLAVSQGPLIDTELRPEESRVSPSPAIEERILPSSSNGALTTASTSNGSNRRPSLDPLRSSPLRDGPRTGSLRLTPRESPNLRQQQQKRAKIRYRAVVGRWIRSKSTTQENVELEELCQLLSGLGIADSHVQTVLRDVLFPTSTADVEAGTPPVPLAVTAVAQLLMDHEEAIMTHSRRFSEDADATSLAGESMFDFQGDSSHSLLEAQPDLADARRMVKMLKHEKMATELAHSNRLATLNREVEALKLRNADLEAKLEIASQAGADPFAVDTDLSENPVCTASTNTDKGSPKRKLPVRRGSQTSHRRLSSQSTSEGTYFINMIPLPPNPTTVPEGPVTVERATSSTQTVGDLSEAMGAMDALSQDILLDFASSANTSGDVLDRLRAAHEQLVAMQSNEAELEQLQDVHLHAGLSHVSKIVRQHPRLRAALLASQQHIHTLKEQVTDLKQALDMQRQTAKSSIQVLEHGLTSEANEKWSILKSHIDTQSEALASLIESTASIKAKLNATRARNKEMSLELERFQNMTDVDVDMLLLARQHYMELCRKGMVVLQQFNSVATTLVSGSSSDVQVPVTALRRILKGIFEFEQLLVQMHVDEADAELEARPTMTEAEAVPDKLEGMPTPSAIPAHLVSRDSASLFNAEAEDADGPGRARNQSIYSLAQSPSPSRAIMFAAARSSHENLVADVANCQRTTTPSRRSSAGDDCGDRLIALQYNQKRQPSFHERLHMPSNSDEGTTGAVAEAAGSVPGRRRSSDLESRSDWVSPVPMAMSSSDLGSRPSTRHTSRRGSRSFMDSTPRRKRSSIGVHFMDDDLDEFSDHFKLLQSLGGSSSRPIWSQLEPLIAESDGRPSVDLDLMASQDNANGNDHNAKTLDTPDFADGTVVNASQLDDGLPFNILTAEDALRMVDETRLGIAPRKEHAPSSVHEQVLATLDDSECLDMTGITVEELRELTDTVTV